MRESEDILWFWFGDDPSDPLKASGKWWKKDPEFDREICDLFEEDLEEAAQGGLDSWKETPQGTLAFIILLDQFSRNIYRDTPKAFAQDPLALATCLKGL